MPIEVELPDGSTAEFPDGTPHEVMKSAISKRFAPKPQPDVAIDAAKGLGYGFNEGIDATLNAIGAPVRAPVNAVSNYLGYGDVIPELQAARRLNVAGPAETTAGRTAQAIGEVTGASALPGIGLQTFAARAGAAAPGILGTIASNPTAAAATDAASAVGSGLGVSYAREKKLGPVAELGLGLAGGYAAPNAINMAARSYAGAKAAGRFASNAMEAAQNPEQAAYRNIADKGVQSGVDFDDMRRQVMPEISSNLAKRGLSDQDIGTIISRQLAGEHADDVALDFKISGDTAKKYLQRYHEKNPTPLNVVDMAKLSAGEGKAAPLTRYARAVHSIGGKDDGTAAEALIGRQEAQPSRVASIIEKRMGEGDFAKRKAAHAEALSQESNKAYKTFYDEPELAIDNLADLMEEPMFRNAMANAKRQERLSIIKENQDIAKRNAAAQTLGKPNKVEPLKPVPDVNEETQVFSPQALDLIQRDLRLTGEGFSNPNEANYARNLREVFLDRIEEHYPSFRKLRTTYASGKMEQDAFDAGVKLSSRLGTKTSEALADFEKMTPAQQAIFRDSFGTALRDKALSTPKGNQVANQYSSDGFRQIIERLFPKSDKALYKDGQDLLKELNVERVTTKTKNDMLSGSRTAELSSDMDAINTPAEAAAHAFTGNWWGIMRTLGKRLSQQIGTEGAKRSLKILSETSPEEMPGILTRLAQEADSSAKRQAYVMALKAYKKAGFRPATAVGTFADTVRDRRQP